MTLATKDSREGINFGDGETRVTIPERRGRLPILGVQGEKFWEEEDIWLAWRWSLRVRENGETKGHKRVH